MTLKELAAQAASYGKKFHHQVDGEIVDKYLSHLEQQGATKEQCEMFILLCKGGGMNVSQIPNNASSAVR